MKDWCYSTRRWRTSSSFKSTSNSIAISWRPKYSTGSARRSKQTDIKPSTPCNNHWFVDHFHVKSSFMNYLWLIYINIEFNQCPPSPGAGNLTSSAMMSLQALTSGIRGPGSTSLTSTRKNSNLNNQILARLIIKATTRQAIRSIILASKTKGRRRRSLSISCKTSQHHPSDSHTCKLNRLHRMLCRWKRRNLRTTTSTKSNSTSHKPSLETYWTKTRFNNSTS